MKTFAFSWLPRVLLILTTVGSAQLISAKPNVLLLSIDTLRADALHSYGFPNPITPTIDGLAADGVLFEDAMTTIGKTGPSFSSLFTSLSPPTHGARRNGVPLRDDVPTLAETFSANGYETAAFISNWTLRSRLAKVDRGFDTYDEKFDAKRNPFGARERTAPAVIGAVKKFLESRRPLTSDSTSVPGKPLFLWVHFSEPHTPFDLHDSVAVPKPEPKDRTQNWQKRWRYANEVAYTDTQVAALLEILESRLDLAETTIVFLGDHGESLGEHGYWGHGKNTHWANLHIPLILKGPGIPKGMRVRQPVMITDIFPTLIELAELEPLATSAMHEGLSLMKAWSEGLSKDRLRFTVGDRHTAFRSAARKTYEHPKEVSLQSKSVKVVFDFSSKKTKYFDLTADPRENRPLSVPPRKASPPWRRQLVTWYETLPRYEAKSGEISEEDRKQLESLGYVGP